MRTSMLGIAAIVLVVVPEAQVKPTQDPCIVALTKWSDAKTPVTYRFDLRRPNPTAAVGGDTYTTALGTMAVVADGVAQIDLIDKNKVESTGTAEGVVVTVDQMKFRYFKLNDVLALQAPGGDWQRLLKSDCMSEVVKTATSAGAYKYSQKLLSAVGEGQFNVFFAKFVQETAFLRDPRGLISGLKESTFAVKHGNEAEGNVADVSVDLPDDKLVGLNHGTVSKGMIQVHLEKSAVKSIRLSLHHAGNSALDAKDRMYWDLQELFEVKAPTDQTVPAEVVTILKKS